MWDNFFYLNTSTSKHNIISFKYEIKNFLKYFFKLHYLQYVQSIFTLIFSYKY